MAPVSSSSRFLQVDPDRLNAFFAKVAGQLTRPAVEFSMLMTDPVFWGWGVPRGDGHTVLALPGLGGGDAYLRPLRTWLQRIGYRPIESGLDVNPGWSEELLDELTALVADQFRRSRTKLTIIGHSLGGVYGYAITAHYPQMVRHIVTLASPLARVRSSVPSTVAVTSFYSRRDSIVRHPAAVARDPHADSIEVDSSHIGMASHPEVYRRLGRLLREPAANREHSQSPST
jgi:pimeloyl-ACP methyl ester carboxylesterase